jgi:PhnB protein
MPKRSLMEQLDQAVEALIGRPDVAPPRAEPRLAPLLDIAQDLVDLPRENFKARLKSDLERKSSMATVAEPVAALRQNAIPYLSVKNAAQAIEFYSKAFGAREVMRFVDDRGRIGHAEIRIGNSSIYLADEFPDYGCVSPDSLGGSPVKLHLNVQDVDGLAGQALSAGAKVVRPVEDQFYGDRSGQFADPFGYTWIISTHKEDMSLEEMRRRFDTLRKQQETKKPAVSPVPKGYHTLTPYLVVQDAPGLIEFVKQAFGAQQTLSTIGSAGGVHAEVRVGDSILMIGGGGTGLSWHGDSLPTSLHVYVEDADAVYQRALKAGATSAEEPTDQFYGDREAGVKDLAGNYWWIATHKESGYIPKGLRSVTPFLHPLRAEPVINFLKRAFGAEELSRAQSPDGVIHHATMRIGDSALEMGEAHGPYQPMPTMFYLYVPDVDAAYRRALEAGAISISEPADQPYGDRNAGVKDAFGNQWYIATRIKDVTT